MQTADFEHLRLELSSDGRTLLLEFNHGKANEMGTPQLLELERLVERLHEVDAPATLVSYSRKVSSRGTPIFVAGANVTERVGWRSGRVKQHVRWQRRVLTSLRKAPCFHVVVVEGVALGWGTEYLLTADYRIACDRATFALPETGLGILPGAGGTSELINHIGMAHTLRLGMTGERIDADEAQRIGLVQERSDTVDSGLERANALAVMVARRSPTAIAAFKLAVHQANGLREEGRVEAEARAYEHCVDHGDAATGRDHFAEIRSGAEVPWPTRQLPKR
ncbi:MAG: enoyl-CoA hydratase/isomerase family protein [Proteobacteria bacterium]|nr:enoyl-CoA hydratase/isomerase family protein [Pseudomonadota bacterium]